MKISAAVVTFNEEKNLARCLSSLSFCNEIVVVDGRSTDKTVQIAKKFKAKVTSVENQTLMKINMNLAYEKCSCDWILSVDADEEISPELASEIESLNTKENSSVVAYEIPRKNIIFNSWIAHTGWYPDYQTRLFKKGKAHWPAKNVHEDMLVDGETGKLNSAIIHHHYGTISEFLGKMDNYTSHEAEKMINEGKKVVWQDAIVFPTKEFLSRFFDREGFKDGLHGLILSMLMAFYWELVFAKIWEKQKFFEVDDPNFLANAGKEISSSYAQFVHWMIAKSSRVDQKLVAKLKKNILKLFP